MSVTWIIEPDVCAAYCDSLVAEIASQGHVHKTIPAHYTSLDWGDTSRYYDEFAPKGSCVVCHASFQFTIQVAEDELWAPGVYGSRDTTDCTQYFPRFEDCLLNRDHEIIAVSELHGRGDLLFKSFGVDDRIFIRPNSGTKSFAGRLFNRSELNTGLSRSTMSPHALVVVSRPKSICREWRFVVADRCVIAASMYKDREGTRMSPDVSQEAFEFAAVVAARDFQPDRVWVLDTCETAEGEMKVVEINGFSSSSWYCCSVTDVVTAVSRVAVDDWKRSMAHLGEP
ncbi:MAG: ATP-grasp domain-containing protein [Planctomycetales bacterium]|nr:ATP-grasp domain-containing protein [Planctomycetales bacterium]